MSRSTRRGVISALLAGAMLLPVAGCGKSSDGSGSSFNDAPPGSEVSPSPVPITSSAGSAQQQAPLQWQQPMQPAASVQPGQNPPAATTAPPSQAAAQPTANNAEYEKNLQKQSLQRAYDGIVQRYTQGKMAIVVINGVGGVEADADHYLERKVFKAAYADYQDGQKRASQMTEVNRQAAAQQATAEHQNTWGGFGPQTVWFKYKQVESDVPYPDVKGGSFGNGQYIYYAGPVLDLNQFASRLAIGTPSIDQNGRTIVIQSALPVPVPDIDVEELYIQHGRESVVMMDVTNAEGDSDDVTYFLETEVQNLSEDKSKLTVVGPRLTKPGTYRLFIAPVKSINALTSRITFGSIADLNPSEQSVLITAKLPAELPRRPTAAELAEMERIRWEGDKRPKAGESEIDWAIRVLEKLEANPSLLEHVCNRLSQLDVEESRKEDVAKALIAGMENTWAWHRQDAYLRAMETWLGSKLTNHFIRMLSDPHPKFGKDKILDIMARNPSEAGAKAAAMLMTDFFQAKNASAALREMGPVAEPVVLKLATDKHPTMRVEAYDILTEIGTSKGLAKLKGLVSKEKVKEAREALKYAIEELESRLQEEAEEAAATGSGDNT
ncbi:MAG: HEAT repeat domain-containing protein [Planctomycetaceae bacterium]